MDGEPAYDDTTRRDAPGDLLVTDREQIRELLASCIPGGTAVSNPLRPAAGLLDATATVRDPEDPRYKRYLTLTFAPDSVPDFVLRYFETDREMLAESADGLF